MQFNWTTFALEIINFLVLIWILQRFLYKPVLNAIAQRKAAIDKTLDDARAVQAEAAVLRQRYEHRLDDWKLEQKNARAQFLEEIAAERKQSLAALQTSLAQEQERNRVLQQRRDVEVRRVAEDTARVRGGQFVARLLSRVAGPELEHAILTALLEDLPDLPEVDMRALRAAGTEPGVRIEVSSTFPIAQANRDVLTQALGRMMGHPVTCEFTEEPNLLSGLHIRLGSWTLHANLRDELAFFAEAENRAH